MSTQAVVQDGQDEKSTRNQTGTMWCTSDSDARMAHKQRRVINVIAMLELSILSTKAYVTGGVLRIFGCNRIQARHIPSTSEIQTNLWIIATRLLPDRITHLKEKFDIVIGWDHDCQRGLGVVDSMNQSQPI